jgi:glycerol-3-phosphate acyltransferase PlsX
VICDGFVGNIVLKLAEGLADGLMRSITAELDAQGESTQSLVRDGLERVWNRHDYSRYGGAPLLGVNSACMICHGRSNEQAIANAVRAAMRFVEMDLNRAIEARLSR